MPLNRRALCIFVKNRVDEYCNFVKPKYDATEHFFLVALPNVKWTGGRLSL